MSSNGTITNATYVPGIVGNYAMQFSGNTYTVDATIPEIVYPFSISFWYKPVDELTTLTSLIHFLPSYLYPRISTGSTGRLIFFGGPSRWKYTPLNSFVIGNWHHVILEISGPDVEDFHWYINGILSDGEQGTNEDEYDNLRTPLRIGGSPRIDIFDEILFYDKILTSYEKEVLFLKGMIKDGLILRYSFEEGSGTNANETADTAVDVIPDSMKKHKRRGIDMFRDWRQR